MKHIEQWNTHNGTMIIFLFVLLIFQRLRHRYSGIFQRYEQLIRVPRNWSSSALHEAVNTEIVNPCRTEFISEQNNSKSTIKQQKQNKTKNKQTNKQKHQTHFHFLSFLNTEMADSGNPSSHIYLIWLIIKCYRWPTEEALFDKSVIGTAVFWDK